MYAGPVGFQCLGSEVRRQSLAVRGADRQPRQGRKIVAQGARSCEKIAIANCSGDLRSPNLQIIKAGGQRPPLQRRFFHSFASPGRKTPHPTFGTPLPRRRERGRGRWRPRNPTAGAVGYGLPPASRADFINELPTQDTIRGSIKASSYNVAAPF